MKLRAKVGLNYGPKDTRVEAGEEHDFPPKVGKVYLAEGQAELVGDSADAPEGKE